MLEEHRARVGTTAQAEWVSSHLTFGSEMSANLPWQLLAAGTFGAQMEIPNRTRL